MRKSIILSGILILILGISSAASGNLIMNPGFESDEGSGSGWTLSGAAAVTSKAIFVHSGDYAGRIGDHGALKQNVTLTDAPSHIFGGYMRIWTENWVSNWDQVQATLWVHIPAVGKTFGTDPGNLGSANFYPVPPKEPGGGFITDWIYFEDELLTPGLGGYAAVLNLNINSSSANGIFTAAAFDDLFVKAVPESSTLILLGIGLIGLTGLRRKIKN